jgi:outer membrane protein assembly factor BamD (BamD/ComL family)
MRTRLYTSSVAVLMAIVVASSVSAGGQTSETQRNREVIQRHLELMNRGEWRQAAEYFAEVQDSRRQDYRPLDEPR